MECQDSALPICVPTCDVPSWFLGLHCDLPTIAFMRLGTSLIAFGQTLPKSTFSKVNDDFLIPTVRKVHGALNGLQLTQKAIISFQLLMYYKNIRIYFCLAMNSCLLCILGFGNEVPVANVLHILLG